MTSDRQGRAADEPASAPRGDELATVVTQPIPQFSPAFQAPCEATGWPPLDSTDPEAFLRDARTVVEEFADRLTLGLSGNARAHTDAASLAAFLTQSGEAAAVVLETEFEHRFPSTSSAGVREGLMASFDARLLELAGATVWSGGAA
jgi:hypothetical protein